LALGSMASAVTVFTAATGDNAMQMWVDGVLKVTFDQTPAGLANLVSAGNSDWKNVKTFSMNLPLGTTHVAAVQGIDSHLNVNIGTNASGFIAVLDAGEGAWFAETGTRYLVTSSSLWDMCYVRQQTDVGGPYGDNRDFIVDALSIKPADDNDGDDWRTLAYDEVDVPCWVAANEVAGIGDAPWGLQGTLSTIQNMDAAAKWLWTEDWIRTNAQTPYTDTSTPDSPVFFRTTFTPVPEPLTVMGVMMGLAGVSGYIRRRWR